MMLEKERQATEAQVLTMGKISRRDNPRIAIVAPFYNEEQVVDAFMAELHAALAKMAVRHEIICVDDGSKDATVARLVAHARADSHISVIELSRNFGKEAALTAGIDYARERAVDAVVIIDSDLQHPPQYIADLLAKWQEGFDTVLARRVDRKTDGKLRAFLSGAYYDVINGISEVHIPPGVGDFRLLDRGVVNAICKLRESKRFMKGLYAWVGFKCAVIDYEVSARHSGNSKFNGWRLWNFALEGITSFSTFPLRIWTYLGMLIGFGSTLYGLSIVVSTLRHGVDVPGYASLITAILFLGGIQLIGIGIIGEYLGRAYIESKHRPAYIVREIHSAPEVAGVCGKAGAGG